MVGGISRRLILLIALLVAVIAAMVVLTRRESATPPSSEPLPPPASAQPANAERPDSAPPSAVPAPASARPPAATKVDREQREAEAIDALVRKGDIGRARAMAEEFLARHQTGPYAAHIEALTGVHPHPPAEP